MDILYEDGEVIKAEGIDDFKDVTTPELMQNMYEKEILVLTNLFSPSGDFSSFAFDSYKTIIQGLINSLN